jgi:hypothetical protein
MNNLLRTTSFRVPASSFGQVFTYRAGNRFRAAWQAVEDASGLTGEKRLPYSSACTALQILTGDFVAMYRRAGAGNDNLVLVSRKELRRETLEEVFIAWEYAILPNARGALPEAIDDLHQERRTVGDFIEHRTNQCPKAPGWVWDAAKWELSHKLASALFLDGGITAPLRLDTEAGLLTWDTPLTLEWKARSFRAMHRLEPHIITIPGLESLVVHVTSSLVRQPMDWSSRVRSAWIDRGPNELLLNLRVRRDKAPRRFVWRDLVANVLRRLSTAALVEPDEVDLSTSTSVRGRLWQAPASYQIGTGPGQMFHEAVALHCRRVFQDAEPLMLERARRTLSRPAKALLERETLTHGVRAAGTKTLRLVSLYAEDATRERLARVVREVFPTVKALPDDTFIKQENIELLFTSPDGSRNFLTQKGKSSEIGDWIRQCARNWLHDRVQVAVLAETSSEAEREADGDDPKFVIRRELAKLGIVSQFISESSTPRSRKPTKDHAAWASAWDLLRSAGVFPKQFPTLPQIGEGTWLVGVHLVKKRDSSRKSSNSFVLSLVAAEAGTQRCIGFAPDGQWRPLGIATAQYLAAEHGQRQDIARKVAESAIAQLAASYPESRQVIFVNADKQGRLWTGLSDTGDGKLPPAICTNRTSVIRVRIEDDYVPRPAGLREWPSDGSLRKPGTMNALVRPAKGDYPGAWFYASSPRAMMAQGDHRCHTRFAAPPEALRDNWQSMNLTEFLCLHPGPFGLEALYELSATLCRHAPTWDGTLNLPAPLHLAKAMVLDHPGKYLQSSSDEEESEGE